MSGDVVLDYLRRLRLMEPSERLSAAIDEVWGERVRELARRAGLPTPHEQQQVDDAALEEDRPNRDKRHSPYCQPWMCVTDCEALQ